MNPRPQLKELPFAEVVVAVQARLRRGETKEAVELAREAHVRLGTADSESLAVEAYLARIASLEARGLSFEARQLADSIRKRFPSARARLDEQRVCGGLAAVVAPLADPDLGSEQRAAVEDRVRREVADLPALAVIRSLPAEHPLRVAAAALDRALVAATSGPVEEAALLLPEVSRRSPLAPWKSLVRAIALYHRNDDAGCEQALAAIPADAVPARVVPALRALLRGEPGGPLSSPASGDELGSELAALELALSKGSERKALRAIERAAAVVGRAGPDLVAGFRRLVSMRAGLRGFDADRVKRALGGPSRKDSRFWQLFARQKEEQGQLLLAVAAWAELLRLAGQEGRLSERSPEAGVVLLHMEGLLGALGEELELERAAFQREHDGWAAIYADQPVELRPPSADPGTRWWYLDPLALLERACAADPHPEAFQRWLARVRSLDGPAKEVDRVAEAWRLAAPSDPRPLLELVASAEARGAYAKALGYLEEAESLDRLNPEVRRARYRLLVATARRHARQRKPHLLEQDLAEIEALVGSRDGARAVLLDALRWLATALRGAPEAEERAREVEAALGSGASAASLLEGLARACGRQELRAPAPRDPSRPVLAPMARACLAAREGSFAIEIGAALGKRLLEEAAPGTAEAAANGGSRAGSQELQALAEALLDQERREAAHAIAGIGLRAGGTTQARFLLLRARSLPDFSRARRLELCAAAAELARRQRDQDLVREAVDHARSADRLAFGDQDKTLARLPAEEIERVVAREKSEDVWPRGPTAEDRQAGRCACPLCAGMRGRGALDSGLLDDDEDGDDDDDADGYDGAFGVPSLELERLVLEIERKYGRRGVDDPRWLQARDPELFARMAAALIAGSFLPDLDTAPAGGRGRRRRR